MPQINPRRLLDDLRDLSAIGRYKTGVHRPTLSPPDLQARAWLKSRMTDAGLDARIDGIGNVIGYSSAKTLALVGSHIESQPHAGRLDGALGVLYGLELARVFAGREIGVDVGAWIDEEGFFGSMLGSRSFCGVLEQPELDAASHRDDGTVFTDALRQAGYDTAPRERIELSRYVAYCEAHIEQGDWLDAHDKQIGVVDAIVGTWGFDFRATGIQNHAGTTRMAIRQDAGLALCRLAVALNDALPAVAGERSVWTTGRMIFDPGAYTIIPGAAAMYFEFRDTDPAVLEAMRACVDRVVAGLNADGPCRIEYDLKQMAPTPMAGFVVDALRFAADVHAPGRNALMPSAAGHDANIFGLHMPTGMLFVPSIGGISHHYDEDTDEDDIVAGCQVFADAVETILTQQS